MHCFRFWRLLCPTQIHYASTIWQSSSRSIAKWWHKNHRKVPVQEIETQIRCRSPNWPILQKIHRNYEHSFQDSSNWWEHYQTTFWNLLFRRCRANYWVPLGAILFGVWRRVLYFCVITDSNLLYICYLVWRTHVGKFLVRLNQRFNRRMHERTRLLSPLALQHLDNSSFRRMARYQSFVDVARVSGYRIDSSSFSM